MVTPSDALRSHVLEVLAPVCSPMHEHLELATARAAAHHREFDIPTSGYEQTNLTRSHMNALVRQEPLPGLELREPCSNGRILFMAEGGTTLRVLHQGPGGAVPSPGRSQARIRYYEQQQLAIPNFGLASALLAVWSASPEGEVTLRIVRPIGKWRFGKTALIDLDLVLPRTPQELQDLEFRPDDSGMALQIPRREAPAEELLGLDDDR